MALEHVIAVAQINPTVGDLIGNGKKVIEYIEKAKAMGADIVVFPEQVVTGYPALDLLLHDDFVRDTAYVNDQIAKNTQGITAIIGTIEATDRGEDGKSLHNVALVIRDGKVIGKQAKTLLPTYDVFHELRYFTPASSVDPIEIDGVKYGIQLCEDMWDDTYGRKVTKELAEKGAEIIINLSASPFYMNKKRVRSAIMKKHAQTHNIPFLYVNMVGGQDELIFDGGSMMVNADGSMAYQLPMFEESLTLIDLKQKQREAFELMMPEDEAFQGLTLGLRDYMRKNNLKKIVLGLSGGIDSAVSAAIAVEAVGAENVKGLALPSQFNTSHALEDAKALAQNLGIAFDIIPIKGMYDAAMAELSRTFEGKEFDVTEENIQARMRMMVLMAYVNKHGYALLNTGDKSEVALGYCTLYGDMSGGISVISDLTKPEVYAIAQFYNTIKGKEIIPEHTISKPPSPELKPGQVAPFDYERLSPLLEQMTGRKTIDQLRELGYEAGEIKEMYRKWKHAEFKRWQAPIALKCKPVSFGKGRIYPVTNGYIPSALFREATKEEARVEPEKPLKKILETVHA